MKKALILAIGVLLTSVSAVTAEAQRPGRARGAVLTGCLPTCSATDGRFLALSSGAAFAPLSRQELSVQITVPPGRGPFTLGIFDGDNGAVDSAGDSHWDRGDGSFEFQVLANGASLAGREVFASESLFSGTMPDDDWFLVSVPRLKEAKISGGGFSYTLRIVNLDPTANLINSFKLAVDGVLYISSKAQPFGIFTALTSLADAEVIYPSFPDLQPTTYDGSLTFFLDVPAAVTELLLWDGDLDFGSYDNAVADTDDADTPGTPFVPSWTSPYAVAEGVALGDNGGTGSPADDGDPAGQGIYLLRSPSPTFELRDPLGRTYRNLNPSGNQEWEQFRLTTNALDPEPSDFVAPSLPAGSYAVTADGIDLQNMTYWHFDHAVVCVSDTGAPCECLQFDCVPTDSTE